MNMNAYANLPFSSKTYYFEVEEVLREETFLMHLAKPHKKVKSDVLGSFRFTNRDSPGHQ